MSTLTGRLALKDVIEQGWKQLQSGFLNQLRQTLEGLLVAERDRRVAECRQRGEKVHRWGYTVRKCLQTLWGALEQVRPPLAGPGRDRAAGKILAPWAAGSCFSDFVLLSAHTTMRLSKMPSSRPRTTVA
jgi:hypothetical protein